MTNFYIVLVNRFAIGKFFNYTDKPLFRMRSSLIYKFICVHCTSEYVGLTTSTITDEHVVVSFRTVALLTKPPHSAVMEHLESRRAAFRH